ncbi:TIGR03118 family protein [Geothrix oryzisoli]|uniref:TIGR03118 family protein n=1 Tax=Geothrix oryzisoli TaxID=2922721 RepID=UPI001FADA397|nr:TIGR03118 family protein [Geothrix oryzisoli]
MLQPLPESTRCASVRQSRRPLFLAGAASLLVGLAACGGGSGGGSSMPAAPPTYQWTALVADQASAGATTVDPNLVNPWGLAYGPTTRFWVADQGTATTTVYDGLGHPLTTPLVVSDPPVTGAALGGPTGIVFSGTTGFAGDTFILASLDGSLSGWSAGATAVRRVDHSGSAAVYTGLAIGTNGTATYLFAANFNGGAIEVFDSSYAPVNLGAAAWVDPALPAGYAPFNVQVLAGKLYVAYAKHDPPAMRETTGAGLGVLDVFNLDGTFVRRVAAGGLLNAPWGLALAPATFGTYGGALLVGNFGDGRITAFDATTGAQLGQLSGPSGAPLALSGLWGMTFGNDGSAGQSNLLYVTAGPQAQAHGVFGIISYGSAGTGGGTGGGGYGY